MQERRRYIRITTPVLIEYLNPDTKEPVRSFTRDLSETGLRFPTTLKLHIGNEIPLSLIMPALKHAVKVVGRVVWIKEIARQASMHYEVGMRFCWIEDPDLKELSRCIDALAWHAATLSP